MKRLAAIFLILLALAAGALWWFLRPTRTTFLTDADTIRESAASASLREVLWQRPTPIVDLVNTGADEFEPRVTADGGTLFFVRGKPGHNTDIFFCTRDRAGWTSPVSLVEINTEHDELGPEPAADGQSLYFYSDRPGGLGGYDLWVSRKGENGWQPPTNLGASINSPYNEYGPALAPDGRTLCFSSNRPKPGEVQPSDDAWRATVREDLYRHDYDLYASTITDAGYQAAAPIAVLNSPGNDGAPAFSPIGDFLYFSSDRPTGHGGFDLYRTRILRGQFQTPTNLGSAVNTAANELDPALDVGGYALHFSSDRPVANAEPLSQAAGSASAPRYHLYRTFSREVFQDVEVRQAAIDWATLWRQVGPNLMWALLALILFILLLALLRDLSRRRLSLLTRCLIVSLMIHMLLMLWFNAVKVTTSIAAAIRKSAPIQVALAGTARPGDLSLQIRGGLTQAEALPVPAVPLNRAATPIAPTVSATPVEIAIEKIAAAPRESSSIRARIVESAPLAGAAPPRGTVTAEFAAGTTSFALPADVARNDSPEITETAPLPLETAKIGRNRMQVPTSQPDRPPHRVELAVEETGVDQRVPRSLVAAGLPATLQGSIPGTSSDAHLPSGMPVSLQTTLAAAMLGATSPIEPALPTADAAPRQIAGAEVSTVVAVQFSAPPRAGSGLVAARSARIGTLQQLRPDDVAPSAPQPGVADTRVIGSLDAKPGFGPPPAVSTALALGDDSSGRSGGSNTGSSGATGRGSEYALPSAGRGPRTSNAEIAGDSPGTGTANAFGAPARAAISLRGIGGGGPASPATLAPAPSSASMPGGQSLVAGSPFGTGRGPTGRAGASDARIPAALATNLPISVASPTTIDPAAVAIRLPDEVNPPPQPPAPQAEPPNAVGRIRGRVTDAATSARLADARIQLDLPGGTSMIISTDAAGAYQLAAPELPDFFALSASKPGYLPKTRNVANRAVVGRTMRLNFALQPESMQIVALEDSPIVHHLGNDAYEGRINSQFQRSAEGRMYTGAFELSAGQLTVGQAEVELLAKGVQCPHKIRINGHLLGARLDHSPEDGSFGSFTAQFDASFLQVGTNSLEIRAVSCNGDLDDFEFINLQIRLLPQTH